MVFRKSAGEIRAPKTSSRSTQKLYTPVIDTFEYGKYTLVVFRGP